MVLGIAVFLILVVLGGFAFVMRMLYDAEAKRAIKQANIMLQLNEAMENKDAAAMKRIVVLNCTDLDKEVKKEVSAMIDDMVIEQDNMEVGAIR
jgi:hypothetical protein